ncbi:MAG: DUF1501 domain-containing protein [Verrucomicrobiota bacterium]|jgi:uncharacterized protein (DUF1501 family)
MNRKTQTAPRDAAGVARRDFLRAGALGLLGFTLQDWLTMKAHGQAPEPKAKSVIQLWMAGGPTHLDTFDPKPEAGEAYCGPLKNPIATNVAGIRIGELLPLLAKQADKYSIIRSFTHSHGGHETATYVVQTGRNPSVELSYPAIGAVVALKKGQQCKLPPYITLTSPIGRFSEAGFLGSNYKSFVTGGDPNAAQFNVQGIVPPPDMTAARLQQRRGLLQTVDALDRDMGGEKLVQSVNSFREQSYALVIGDAKTAFDLSQEKKELRDRYGRHHFGQCCLLARRLVENEVPFITINHGGWDTEVKHFDAMKQLLPVLDQAFSALLEDLAQRGLLSSTMVVWYGEFGRTPKVYWEAPWYGGRHHWPYCYSCVVAGGGFKGGVVVGQSDDKGEQVKARPVYPWDLAASMYKLLGIDPAGRLPHPQGCGVAYVTPQAAGQIESGGLLTEIM